MKKTLRTAIVTAAALLLTAAGASKANFGLERVAPTAVSTK